MNESASDRDQHQHHQENRRHPARTRLGDSPSNYHRLPGTEHQNREADGSMDDRRMKASIGPDGKTPKPAQHGCDKQGR